MNEQTAIELVLKLAECTDPEDMMRLIRENPIFLNEEMDAALEERQHRMEGTPELQQALEAVRHLLKTCRESGIEGAFAAVQVERESEPTDPIVQHVLDFIDAPAWGISKRIVQENPDLLSDEADALFLELMRSYAGNEKQVNRLQEHRELLQECRRLGIDAAFASRMETGIDQEALLQVLWQFFNTPPGREEKRIIEQNPLLLDRYVDVLLDTFIMPIAADDPQSYEVIKDKYTLLVTCRTEGVEAAFAKRQTFDQAAGQDLHSDGAEEAEDLDERINQVLQALLRPGLVTDVSERISLYYAVLNMLPPSYSPEIRAALQTDLANHLLKFTGGKRAENVAEAIFLSRQALEVRTREKNPEHWAISICALANAYAENTQGDASGNLDQAIHLYESALEVADPAKLAALRISILNGLAGAYMQRLRGDAAENIERALEFVEEALELIDPGQSTYEWAMLMGSYANLFSSRVKGDKAENIEKAIECYQQIIVKLPEDEFPYEWAALMNNLGKAYGERLRGDPVENAEKEIQIYQQALKVTTQEEMPLEWAQTMCNLGVAYIQRQRGDPAENIESAINTFEQALQVRTFEADPRAWANIKHNLSIAYQKRIKGDRTENDEKAITLLNEALKVNTLEDMPRQWEEAMNELALSIMNREGGDRAENIEQAIGVFSQLLTVRTKTTEPFNWGQTKLNLAKAYAQRIKGDPIDTFFAQIECLRDVLSVFTIEAMPEYHCHAQKMLGRVYFAMENWGLAHEAFSAALEAGDRIYHASNTRESRDLELRDLKSLSAYATYSLVKQTERQGDGRLDEIILVLAVIELENGRTRALNEKLGLDQVALHLAREEEQTAFLGIREKIKALEIEARMLNRPGQRDFLAISEDLRQARRALASIVQQIRERVPQFMPGNLDFPTFQEFVDQLDDPLIYILTTSNGSLALVILPADRKESESGLPAIRPCWLDQLTSENLHDLLYDTADQPRYLLTATGADKQILMPMLDEVLPVINERLMQPLADFVTSLGYAQAILVPTGILSLLPLHAPVFDKLCVSFVPSARSLHGLQHAHSDNTHLNFLGIGATRSRGQSDLPFTNPEIQSIADEFSRQNLPQLIRAGGQATFDEVAKVVPGAGYLHFACHGQIDLKTPLNSRLFLSNGDGLTLQNLLDGDINISTARLAVLSACQTGIIEYENLPDEAVGFPAGFIQAGVKGVVSTLWPVSDFSTFLLLREFYRNHLERKMEPAQALYRAQQWLSSSSVEKLDLIGQLQHIYEQSAETNTLAYRLIRYYKNRPNETPFGHPYYWAPFIYTGL